MNNSIVSVIITTIKGREKLLERAIASVKNQTYKNIEIIVVNEGKPAPEQRNIGVNRAKGDYIAFLDDDDEWLPTKLEEQMKVMEKYPDCPLVTCYSMDYRFGKHINKPRWIAVKKHILNAFNYSSTSTYLCRADALKEVGGFDESLPSAQEYDLAIRLAKDGNNIRCVEKVLVIQHRSKNQISRNWIKKIKGTVIVYKKHKKAFIRASFLNPLKLLGITILFTMGFIFGRRIYSMIYFVKKCTTGNKMSNKVT